MGFHADRVREFFPKEEFRDGQEKAIKFACDAFNSGKRIVVLECPTGGGKSTIGMTLANMANSSYYLTVTKILQDQLMSDFGKDVIELKGRGSYECDFYSRFGEKMVSGQAMTRSALNEKLNEYIDCNSGYCKSNAGRKDGHKCSQCFMSNPALGVPKGDLAQLPDGKKYSACSYYEQVFQAINGKNVCMNFYSFLYQTMMTKRFDAPRELMIIDEAHATESVLLDVVSFMLSSDMLKDYGLLLPEYDNIADYIEWIENERVLNVIGLALENAKREENHRAEEDISRLIKKINQFFDSVGHIEWVVQIEKHEYRGKRSMNAVFKPVFVKSFIESLLFRFADKVLMMSATILDIDVFARSLGLNADDIAVYKMKNRFPVKNRPIYVKSCGNLTGGKAKMAEWMPAVVDTVDEICGRYSDHRGIIHTHNFAILDGLLEHCKPSVRSRFITQREVPDKKELLEKHSKIKGSIIIAPAMHEGVDLKDDLSRFQIIAKVPFPNFFDNKQLARRNDLDPTYTNWLTSLKMVQSYGRSIRSADDYADTYIIDGSFYGFQKRCQKMLPKWFLEAIHDGDKR